MAEPQLGLRFEAFAKKLLSRYALTVIRDEETLPQDAGYSFLVRTHEGWHAVVGVKLYRSLQVSNKLLQNVADQLNQARLRAQAPFAILFTNLKMDGTARAPFHDPSFAIYDYDVIGSLIHDQPELGPELYGIYQEAFAYRSEPIPEATKAGQPGLSRQAGHPDQKPTRLSVKRGDALCIHLKGTRPGGGDSAKLFENTCEEILRYIFDGDLTGWRKQAISFDSLHRYDLIARVASKSDFWTSLISDYRARYVIFEFKNYSDQITQKEIYSTEKYLMPIAMRSMSIIIARTGADANANKVMAGALRESGKLILCIDIDQLCDMLHKFDRGEDPSTILQDALDDMLIRLER